MSDEGLAASLAKAKDAGIEQAACDVFAHYYRQLESGVTGVVPEDSIEPLTEVPKLADVVVEPEVARAALAKTVIIKLNGGLGTSMGLDRAKTLLEARDGMTFLDLIVAQVQHIREKYDVRLPLLFMHSFRTRMDTLAYLERFPDLTVDELPLDFLQNAEVKLGADDLMPVVWPSDPSLEWCPPGHGDLYPALWGTGLLQQLLDAGFRYANVANGDNLGAVPNATLAGWFAASGAPFALEVCTRTANDRKGGHLAIRKTDGRMILRESAQTRFKDLEYFTDENRHPYFNTNNLWLDLEQVNKELTEQGGVLDLPMIRNEKTVDPSDPASPQVIQIETAMGAAVEVFEGSQAIEVGRDRFLPVKTTNELMLLRSDIFALGDDGQLRAQTSRLPEVRLDPRYYRFINDFDARVQVVPSMTEATSLTVDGDWSFDQHSRIVGDVQIPDIGQAASYRD